MIIVKSLLNCLCFNVLDCPYRGKCLLGWNLSLGKVDPRWHQAFENMNLLTIFIIIYANI